MSRILLLSNFSSRWLFCVPCWLLWYSSVFSPGESEGLPSFFCLTELLCPWASHRVRLQLCSLDCAHKIICSVNRLAEDHGQLVSHQGATAIRSSKQDKDKYKDRETEIQRDRETERHRDRETARAVVSLKWNISKVARAPSRELVALLEGTDEGLEGLDDVGEVANHLDQELWELFVRRICVTTRGARALHAREGEPQHRRRARITG